MNLKKLWNSLPKDFKENISDGIRSNVETLIIPKPKQHQGIARLPIVFVLDQSNSMKGDKLTQINNGLQLIKTSLMMKQGLEGSIDSVDNKNTSLDRLDLAIVTFDSKVNLLRDFSPLKDGSIPTLYANGTTKTGDAILQSIELIEKQKQKYEQKGVPFYRPWIFLVTDGEPTDMEKGDYKWKKIKHHLKLGEQNGDFLFFSVGIDGADMSLLNDLSMEERPALKLRKDAYQKMFLWLINSFNQIIASNPGEKVQLEDPTGTKGWGDIEI